MMSDLRSLQTRIVPASLVLLATWSASLFGAAHLEAQQPSPPSCDTTEHAQFDFWAGNWNVQQPDGTPAGTNRIEKILNGCVLMENWTGNGGSIGKSFNMYDRRDGKWKQTWVDGQGGRLDLVGEWADGKMTLRGETPARDGGTIRHEVTWTPRDDGTVQQHWRSSRDGKTWNDSFVGVYVRDGAPTSP